MRKRAVRWHTILAAGACAKASSDIAGEPRANESQISNDSAKFYKKIREN